MDLAAYLLFIQKDVKQQKTIYPYNGYFIYKNEEFIAYTPYSDVAIDIFRLYEERATRRLLYCTVVTFDSKNAKNPRIVISTTDTVWKGN